MWNYEDASFLYFLPREVAGCLEEVIRLCSIKSCSEKYRKIGKHLCQRLLFNEDTVLQLTMLLFFFKFRSRLTQRREAAANFKYFYGKSAPNDKLFTTVNHSYWFEAVNRFNKNDGKSTF